MAAFLAQRKRALLASLLKGLACFLAVRRVEKFFATVSSGVSLRCLIHKTKCGNSNTTLRGSGRIMEVQNLYERP